MEESSARFKGRQGGGQWGGREAEFQAKSRGLGGERVGF